jgi:hypothetical protein
MKSQTQKVTRKIQIRNRRLLKVARILDSVPEEKFNLSFWKAVTPCGTTACAVGWAATDPSFKKAGLRLSLPAKPWVNKFAQIKYQCYLGWEAVEEFFHLDEHEARRLFSPDYYTGNPTTQEVATRIRNFVHHVG